jgi:eukaryotic-like serine/threonine-protein kinase
MPQRLAPFSLPDRYRLEGGIAAGGMAAVYAAHDTVLDRPVAVKVLAEHLSSDEAARRRFQREARAAAALSSHAAVVTIFDVGEHEGRSFIVMEHRTGGTVGDAIAAAGGPIEPRRALGWLRGTAEALDAAHDRGVVHRDIKPANLLLDEHDRVAVADFGIARLAWEAEQVTKTGQVLGTAAYIAPEQAMGEPATAASDRYSLGAVAYELLTGSKPFEGEHFAAQARMHIEDPLPPASERNPRLPRAVDEVLERGMAKEPAERYPSAGAFVDALDRALVPEPTERTRAMAPLAAAAPPPPRRTVAAPGRRRNVPAAVLAAAALILVAIAAAAIALGGGNDGGSEQSSATATPKADKTAEATKTAEPTATQTQTAEPTATQTQAAEPTSTPADTAPSGSLTELNNQGWALYQQGQYGEAVPYFRKAVESCGDSDQLVCQYALYNLGSSLARSGDPAAGIPYLQQRLERFPKNQQGTVKKELKSACKAAGQDCK